MDLGRAFTFVFDDDDWVVKILIGAALQLVPILGQLVLVGYMLETARNVAEGNPRPLPTWQDFGGKIVGGFYGIVVQLFYALPIIVLSLLFSCVVVGIVLVAGDSEAGGALVAMMTLCFVPLAIVFGLIVQPIMLAAMARYVQTGGLGPALQVREIIQLTRENLGLWVVLWLLQILCGFVASLGTIALVIGVFITTFYSQAVFGHMLGQTIRQLGQPNPPAPMPSDPTVY
jgi:hypothetical protein